MRLSFLFLLTLAGLYLTLAQGTYEDCCLKFVHEMNKYTKRMVMSYRMQQTDGGCNIPAVVLTMKKGRRFCVHPNAKWVKELMENVQSKMDGKKPKTPKKQRG
uniref:Chemokine interleukin-8-like domain-containing protein n=1 Tax=Esox lucius TaxID=8010 RepID=A0A3P8YD38_ESOLU